jgi:hypothetical protein
MMFLLFNWALLKEEEVTGPMPWLPMYSLTEEDTWESDRVVVIIFFPF